MELKLLSTLGIIFLILSLTSFIPINYDSDTVDKAVGSDIRVMNFNLHFGVEVNVGYKLEGFRDVILDESPNIIAFQEITADFAVNGFANMLGDMQEMMTDLGYPYSYVQEESRGKLRNAVFSQYEITASKTIYYETETQIVRSFLEIIVDVNGIQARIFATHITHLPVGESGSDRIAMITELFDHINQQTINNFVILGDFNTRDDYVGEYSVMTTTFVDGWNVTHPNEIGATFYSDRAGDEDVNERRIDYILVSPDITVSDCAVIDTDVSDHRPIHCDITLS
ncbi:MAG: hypothetical protein HeimC2_40460 [Candidatus Heimdallarchaeota archaeon LC_2]|nr:MAG: hypothetical protein HeimC2_40460 [Candidatus Heimdallarchaeota archaeon LC_2]